MKTLHIHNLGTRWRWVMSFMPLRKSLFVHWVGSSMNPRDSLVALDSGEICQLCLKSDHESTVVRLLGKLLYANKLLELL